MAMIDFHYSLIRFVADSQRMEPINIGIILQGKDRVGFRLYAHVSRKKGIDAATFQKWRRFFQEEIEGAAVPLFQPAKTSPEFLTYLQELCERTVLLSRPLSVSVDSGNFDQLLDSLYQRLVAPPEQDVPEAANRPTAIFRQMADERKFVQRGMKKHAHVIVGDQPLWTAYRQVVNGEVMAFDKIEVATRIGETANEIERMPYVADQLSAFVNQTIDGKTTSNFLLVDELRKPFAEQSEDEYAAMAHDLKRVVELISNKGGQIISSPEQAVEFANAVDKKLPEPSIP